MDAETRGVLLGVGVGLVFGAGVALLLRDEGGFAGVETSRPQVSPAATRPQAAIGDGGRRPRFPLIGGGGGGADRTFPTREHLVIQREDFTTDRAFTVKQPGVSMPISGPGTLVDAVVVGDSGNFKATVKADGQRIVDDEFTDLELRSSELERIAAYQREADGAFVFAVNDYEFQQDVEVAIDPHESITFLLQRAEVDLVRD